MKEQKKATIVIKNGVVEAAYASDPDLEITILDYDDNAEPHEALDSTLNDVMESQHLIF